MQKNNQDKLHLLRQQIDDVDHQIVQLLEKRVSYVEQVGHYKHDKGIKGSFIRPAREASMVRELIKHLGTHYPNQAILQIWRNIIASSLLMEQGLSTVIYSPDGTKNDGYWLAREYFGSFTPSLIMQDTHELADHLLKQDGSVAILPYPSLKENWWQHWQTQQKLHIFAVIPFIEQSGLSPYLAVANVATENSGNDSSLLIIRSDQTIDSQCLQTANPSLELQAESADHCSALCRVKAYLHAQHPLIQTLEQDYNVQLLGSYANPIASPHQ